MATNQSYSAKMRYARVRAYRLAQKIDQEVLGKGILIPSELSVKESNVFPSPSGNEETSTITFRFEGGNVVRLNLSESYDNSYYMYFWRITSASIMYYRPQGLGRRSEVKSLIVLNQEYFNQQWEMLPIAIDDLLREIKVEKFSLLEHFEAALRRVATSQKVAIKEVSYLKGEWTAPDRGNIFISEISHEGGTTTISVVARLGDKEMERFRSELIARDEKRMTEFIRGGKIERLDDDTPYSKVLAKALAGVATHGLAWNVPPSCLPIKFVWGEKPYVKILKVGEYDLMELEVSLPQCVSLEFDFEGTVDYSGKKNS